MDENRGYLAWRISQKLNKMTTLSFLSVGHTKFSCDWGLFGLFKKKFQTTFVSSIQELVQTVEESTPTSKVNFDIAVGDEIGNTHVPTYNWLKFFVEKDTKKIPKITKFNHFEFEDSHQGVVNSKYDIDGNVYLHRVFPSDDGPSGYPIKLLPQGLSDDRKKYMFTNIRPYCKEEFKNLLCPEVDVNSAKTNKDVCPEPAATPCPSCSGSSKKGSKKRKRVV